MARRRAMTSVLRGFLGAFSSRYSDHDGYWLFGFLVPDALPLRLDLMDDPQADGALGTCDRRARAVLRDQLHKHGLPWKVLRQAELRLEALGSAQGFVHGWRAWGYDVRITVRATVDTGRTFEESVEVFVARHDATRELQSARA